MSFASNCGCAGKGFGRCGVVNTTRYIAIPERDNFDRHDDCDHDHGRKCCCQKNCCRRECCCVEKRCWQSNCCKGNRNNLWWLLAALVIL